MGVCATALIVIATILGPVTMVFMSVSFGTDHWLEFDVDGSELRGESFDRQKDVNMGRYYNTRERGIFRECYPGNNATEFIKLSDDVIDGNCFEISYEMPDSKDNPSSDYKTYIHLSRCFLAFYILGIALFLISYIFGLILCCMRKSRYAYVAGLFAYASAFSIAAAIAFFHGAEYLERNELEDAEFYEQWPDDLKNATDRDYAWSYALGWVGMILASLTATFYSLAGCYITGEKYDDREVLNKQSMRDRPIGMEPVYAVGADAYYTKHYGYPRAYMGPLSPEMYNYRPYPAIGYGDPNKDMWHWHEVES